MGGICGFIGRHGLSQEKLQEMSGQFMHRGPHGHGEVVCQLDEYYAGMASRWLNIRNLPDRCGQPMQSPDGRVSVVFDGEIYNYAQIREEITGYTFQTDCDTEVIVAAYLKWGMGFVKRLNGMFAIALLDRKKNTLYLIRDRMGIKPLYYYVDENGDVLFSSEIKSFFVCAAFQKGVNAEIVGNYLHHMYITGADTIYQNVRKVQKGHVLELCNGEITEHEYWGIAKIYNQVSKNKAEDYEEAKSRLKDLLKESISARLLKNGATGCFLSGGYDSSLIAAIAQEVSSEPIHTYCAGFYEENLNEAEDARRIADHLGTKHTERYIETDEAVKTIEELPQYFEEPMADWAMIPTMILASQMREDVAAAFTGVGGDELFVGGLEIYSKLRQAQQKKKIGELLYWLRKVPVIKNSSMWDKMPLIYKIASEDLNKEIKTQIGVKGYTDCIEKLLFKKGRSLYFEWESRYHADDYAVIRALLDLDTYTSDYELIKEDRATMQFGLERRCPFLDKNVMEYVFSLPKEYKVDGIMGRRIVRDVVREYIPDELLDRPKKGFNISVDDYLRGPLKEQLIDLTDRSFLVSQGIFNADETINFIKAYLQTGDQGSWSGKNYSKIVYPYFVFQQWYYHYIHK